MKKLFLLLLVLLLSLASCTADPTAERLLSHERREGVMNLELCPEGERLSARLETEPSGEHSLFLGGICYRRSKDGMTAALEGDRDGVSLSGEFQLPRLIFDCFELSGSDFLSYNDEEGVCTARFSRDGSVYTLGYTREDGGLRLNRIVRDSPNEGLFELTVR